MIAGQSLVGQHPDLSEAVFGDLCDVVARQGVFALVVRRVAAGQVVVEAHQSLRRGTDPDESPFFGMNTPHVGEHSVPGGDLSEIVLLCGGGAAECREQAGANHTQAGQDSGFRVFHTSKIEKTQENSNFIFISLHPSTGHSGRDFYIRTIFGVGKTIFEHPKRRRFLILTWNPCWIL